MQIEIKNITKKYRSSGYTKERTVLDNISLSISSDENICILGPSGSGKTTLLNLIGTMDKADSGLIKYNQEDLQELSDNELSQFRNSKIGFVFQFHHLLPQLNILENVLLPTIPNKRSNTTKEKAIDLLRSVGLEELIYQKPGQLSGGECQRVAVIRALINNPEIILADEPTGSLDWDSANNIAELLLKISKEKGISLVLVTHSKEIAQKLNKVYVLKNGKLELQS